MKSTHVKTVSVVLAIALFGCQEAILSPTSGADEAENGFVAKRLDGADQGGRQLTASLSGAAEVSPGDPDGSGDAIVTLNEGQSTVCFELSVADILPAVAAHIHRAPAGVNGGVVVALIAPTSGASGGCVLDVDRDLIKAIRQDPAGYYVNVHNPEFPAGALRGQLSR